MPSLLSRVIGHLRDAVTDPLEELTRWERFVRYLYELVRQGARQLTRDRAGTMAASLTYRTLFGLLPVTVVGAGVARAIMGEHRFEHFLHGSISALGLDSVSISSEGSGGAASLGSWLADLVTRGMDVNIAALTWVGVLVLVYSALALMVDIEGNFNVVCRAPQGRSWLRRLPIYWFILTFGPVVAALALWVDAQVGLAMERFVGWDWLLWILGRGWAFLLCGLFLFAIYRLVPSARMRARPALIGALVGAALLLLGRGTLGLYFDHAISLRQIYGSLGLVPVFMFWLYLMWLVILLGLQVSAILQQVGDDAGDR